MTAAFGPIRPDASFIRFIAKVKGAPTNCIEYTDVSVKITTSCLALSPPTILEPEDNLTDPAVLVMIGSKSSSFSWSEKATNIGSIEPVRALPDIGSAPKTIRCLSTSEVITCNPTVGTRLAPAISDNWTALVLVPLFSSQR